MILINSKDFEKIRFTDIEKFLNDFDEEENFFVEFKNDNVNNKDLIKEICAFANTYGGYIFLGVEDDKNITGCNNWTEERINNTIRDLMSPTPIFDIKKLSKNNLKIFVIRIEEGKIPPYVTNKGTIYERISSSSFPIKDSSSINRLIDKRKDNIRKIENKLYIEPIKEKINNLCGYIDFGFSASYKNINLITNKILNADFNKIAGIMKDTGNAYSISKVGYSICITFGEVSMSNNPSTLLVPAGLSNFFELLPDGSFRSRIVLASNGKGNMVPINSIYYMENIFKKVYYEVLGEDISKKFIEANCYEKLVVLSSFEPKIMVGLNDPLYEKFEKYFNSHKEKYGSNLIVNSNRIPMNDFYLIDKAWFEKQRIRFNDKNLINELFRSSYFLLGFIDKFDSNEKTDI